MQIILYILIFFLGASIASFLCVILEKDKNTNFIKLLNSRKIKGNSICVNCKKKLKWYEIIPIISYLIQLGKCKKCKSNIPIRLFISEVILGVFFVNLFFYPLFPEDNPIGLLFYLFIIIYLFCLAYQDYLYKEIESFKLYLFSSIGFLSTLSYYLIEGGATSVFKYYIITISIILFFIFIWYSHYGKDKWMGQGDFLVMLGLLFFYRLEVFINIFIYSIWIGAVYSLFYIFIKYKKFKRGVAMPFIPFLFLGVMFFHMTGYKLFIFKDIIELIIFFI